jgi:gluconolactonase
MELPINVAEGLAFPEGPVALPDGSLLFVQLARGTVNRVTRAGVVQQIAAPGGSPNGAAMGPDGACYVCNSGGFGWSRANGLLIPTFDAPEYSGGRIERIDLTTGHVERLYEACDGHPLIRPNDIVFDRTGGFWFTDLGTNRERSYLQGGLYYATADGRSIREAAFPLTTPNGVGLSPAEDMVYVAESLSGRLLAFRLAAPGRLAGDATAAAVIGAAPGFAYYDSLAVDSEGNVNVATVGHSGIAATDPRTSQTSMQWRADDPYTTNICFGGADRRDAFITLSGTGRIVATRWQVAGLELNFSD